MRDAVDPRRSRSKKRSLVHLGILSESVSLESISLEGLIRANLAPLSSWLMAPYVSESSRMNSVHSCLSWDDRLSQWMVLGLSGDTLWVWLWMCSVEISLFENNQLRPQEFHFSLWNSLLQYCNCYSLAIANAWSTPQLWFMKSSPLHNLLKYHYFNLPFVAALYLTSIYTEARMVFLKCEVLWYILITHQVHPLEYQKSTSGHTLKKESFSFSHQYQLSIVNLQWMGLRENIPYPNFC